MSYKKYSIQLMDHVTGEAIIAAGGVCYVAQSGEEAKATLFSDKNGTSLSNPLTLTRGKMEFFVADTVSTVDLYVMGPNGEFVSVTSVKPMGPNEIFVDSSRKDWVLKIPFDIDDTTANTETDTGFDLPQNAIVHPDGIGVLVVDIDATETIDVGILSSESGGDADGLLDAVSVATAGMVIGTVGFDVGSNAVHVDLTGGDQEFTLGALLCGVGSKVALAEGADTNTDEGFYLLEPYIGDGTAESVSYTLSAGTDTATGFIQIPYRIA